MFPNGGSLPKVYSSLIAIFMNGHHLKLLKELSKDNKLSQRELSRKLGLSLGSVNYVLSYRAFDL